MRPTARSTRVRAAPPRFARGGHGVLDGRLMLEFPCAMITSGTCVHEKGFGEATLQRCRAAVYLPSSWVPVPNAQQYVSSCLIRALEKVPRLS